MENKLVQSARLDQFVFRGVAMTGTRIILSMAAGH
jgi:hypothetical protein